MRQRVRGAVWGLWIAAATASGCGDQKSGGLPADAAVADAPADAAVVYPGPPACPPIPPPPSLPPASPVAAGTRLVPRMLVDPSAGGFEIPWVVHDTLLDADCAPVRFFDRKFRCLPSFNGWQLGPVEVVFADVSRTIPVVALIVDRAPPPGTLVPTGQSVDGLNPIDTMDSSCSRIDWAGMRLGGRRTETTYWRSDLSKVTVQPGYSLYDLTPLPAGFVELQEVRVQLSGSIALRELHGTDGSIVFSTGLYDTAHDVPVGFFHDGAIDRARLIPPPAIAANGLYFKPPPAASGPHPEDACASSDAIFQLESFGGCDVSALRFVSDLGGYEAPRYLPGIVHQVVKSDATLYGCVVGPVHTPWLQECAPSPLTDWTPASEVSVGGRITTPAWKIGDATFAPPDPIGSIFLRDYFELRTFHDTVLDVDCLPRTAADGVLRCLPLQGAVVYADAACTLPVALSFHDSTPSYVARGSIPGVNEGDLRGQITMFSVGAGRPRGRVGVLAQDGRCLFNLEAPSFELGPEVPASTFGALEVRDVPAASAGARAAVSPRSAPPHRAAGRR